MCTQKLNWGRFHKSWVQGANHRDSSTHLRPAPTPNFLRIFLMAQKLDDRAQGAKTVYEIDPWGWGQGDAGLNDHLCHAAPSCDACKNKFELLGIHFHSFSFLATPRVYIIPFELMYEQGLQTCYQLGGKPNLPENKQQLMSLIDSLSRDDFTVACHNILALPIQRSKKNITEWVTFNKVRKHTKSF